jgi:undecaprenyl phosphate N,N'-diacetylbacillosamine 1-phosphate transferase
MYRNFIKPILDSIFALMVFPFLLLLILIVGILIKLEDGGSVFYKAKRLGKNGKPFKMLKFRSMKENAPDIRNADGTTYSSPEDPRLTKIGKILRETSIDELPQFINVLLGQMSVLGPRPDPVEWYEKFSEETRKKYSVKPGVSGYSQAYYRNTLPLDEKNKNEVYYAENITFWFDIKIFFKTLERVLKRGNVYREDVPVANVSVSKNDATAMKEK